MEYRSKLIDNILSALKKILPEEVIEFIVIEYALRIKIVKNYAFPLNKTLEVMKSNKIGTNLRKEIICVNNEIHMFSEDARHDNINKIHSHIMDTKTTEIKTIECLEGPIHLGINFIKHKNDIFMCMHDYYGTTMIKNHSTNCNNDTILGILCIDAKREFVN